MKRTFRIALVAAAVAVAALAPALLLADAASCSVTASSYADSVLNPPSGEDTEFFVTSGGGVPNIMFVLDTSGPMQRLPPDGASRSWGSFEPAANLNGGSGALPGSGYGCTNTPTLGNPYGRANALVYNSPCGTTTFDGQPFNPTPGVAGPDFAQAKDSSGAYCPYMDQGGTPPKTDRPGFDPDFYNMGGAPWFFEPAKVYHDTNYAPGTVSGSDGWSDWSTSPAYATTADFCNTFAGAQQTECNRCMRDQGYFFDGTYFAALGPSCANTAECASHGFGTCIRDNGVGTGAGLEYSGNNDNQAHCKTPNVWFSGNFLNFYPPKFILARKIFKDVLQSVRRVRLGLTIFDAGGNGGVLLEGLSPACRGPNGIGSPSNFDANRTSIKNDINNKNKVAFQGDAPAAETLLDIGYLYLTNGLTYFDSSFSPSSFQDPGTLNQKSVCFTCQASAVILISGGLPTKDGHIPGPAFAANPMTTTVANTAGNYAGITGYNVTDIASTDCPVCNTGAEAADTTIPTGQCAGQQTSGACDDNQNPIPSYLPKVAWYLHQMDFRRDTEKDANGSSGLEFAGKQTVTTYTIGLGTSGNSSALLSHTATAGGGLFNGGSGSDITDAKSLRDAITRSLNDVSTRSTSFGAASLSTLQIASSQGVLIPRFEPSRSAHWSGHLYAFDLFSEFLGGCTPAAPGTSGPANKDYDCDGKCSSVFLVDADGDFIQEDGTGAFKKNLSRSLAACVTGTQCPASQCSQPDPNAPAKPFWDAGSKLAPVKTSIDPVSGIPVDAPNPDFQSSLEWNRRRIYTVIDDSRDGRFTSADRVFDIGAANPDDLVPYLNIKGNRSCEKLAARLAAIQNPIGTTIDNEYKNGTYTACAKTIIDFVRGADIFNERGSSAVPCPTWPTSGWTAYCTRKYQLGDIFHSSPIEVWPPLPSDGYSCPRGLHPQCLPSLFSSSIPNPATVTGNANAYDDYAKSDLYRNRKKFVLVGANDGMLHAFRIERTDPQAGEEIWGFIPPDLLPKLRLLLDNQHHFFVDATPMVRDVWLDSGPNSIGANVSTNALSGSFPPVAGQRAGNEFHTVAIVGERRGGTHYFAFDVTEVGTGGNFNQVPKFMWLYPQPDDPEELSFGETYVDFVPKPPPIGPVRIDRPCGGNAPSFARADGVNRCFEEKWVAFLSGGFDVQYTKGRGVHMVAVDDGSEVWDFSQPAGPASNCDSSQDPRCHLNYPVAATVGMMMWGTQPNFLSQAAVDGYFDTATVGDTGGQLWTLRFSDPGIRDSSTHKVTNWFGARALQHGLNASTPPCGLGYCGGQPFFYITSNLPLATNGLYRTLLGTGDRFNLLDPIGGTCGPDNIRACLIKGCTVTLDDGTAAKNPGAVYGVEPLLGKQSYKMNLPASCSSVDAANYQNNVTSPAGAACTTITSKVQGITITCPSTNTCSGVAETTAKSAAVTCTGDSCDAAASNSFGIPIDMKANPDKLNWFFSVQVFERTGSRQIFSDLAGAKAYDSARLNEASLKNINAYDQNPIPANLASPDDRGWSYFFNHGDPGPNADITVGTVASHVYRTDERNASVSQVEYGCTFWNTMQPAVPVDAFDATACPVNGPCKAGRAQISYLYGAAPGTGGQCLKIQDAYARSQKNETLVPPYIGKLVAYVGQGQVSFGLTTVRVPQGGANVQLGDVQDLSAPTQWLPVDHNAHACRHAPKNAPPTQAACR